MKLPPVRGRFAVLVVALGSLAGAGCSSGGGGGSGMSIESCSLGCADSGVSPGAQISCGVTTVTVNQEIRISFSNPVDPLTVTTNSFRMTEHGGRTPAGTFSLDPSDARVLIYRPQLVFDSTGAPIFGLTEGKLYDLTVLGTALDPLGPFIRSTAGAPNSSRLQCTLAASGISDPKPGRPRVNVTVDVVTGYDPNGVPNDFDFNVQAQGAVNVFRGSPVRMVFDDVMNPGTLANPVTNTSNFIKVLVDANGNLSDSVDRVPITGTFSVTIDQTALRTIVVFTPSAGFPSCGTSPQRKVVVDLSAQITDIGGLPLLDPGIKAFTSELIELDPVVVTELFADESGYDPVRTGSPWGNGLTTPGVGGGSGRLGDLVVRPGIVVELDTDSEDFSDIEVDAFNPDNVVDPPANLEITDGVFEFSRLRVDAGGVLRFKGSNPARLLVRGEAVILGLVDASGASGRLQDSSNLPGGVGGGAGPNGGAGGKGGDRPDGQAFSGIFNGSQIGGVANPGAGPSNVLDPGTYVNVNGTAGGGVPFPSNVAPAPTLRGGGGGALAWPQPTPADPSLHMPQDVFDLDGMPAEKWYLCQYNVPAACGGGGSNAIPGEAGESILPFVPSVPTTQAPETPGGADLLVDDDVRTLSPEEGYLRGGGGGGGGGAHLQQTQVNGIPNNNCSIPIFGTAVQVMKYVAHSSAGGGGGGGAIQLCAGRRIVHSGIIDASGGVGGGGTFPPEDQDLFNLAMGGGGGAGGAVLIQSPVIQIVATANRINVSGGTGGEGSGSIFPVQPTHGGMGSPGLLRLESTTAPDLSLEFSKLSPTAADLLAGYGNAVTVDDIYTSAVWAPPAVAPASWSGAQSCWIRPSGNFFQLVFEEDGADLGWDLRLRIVGQANPQSFRGPNDLFPIPLEQAFGSDFGTSPLVVRFQGARSSGALVEPCAVPETGSSSPLTAGSMTGWVRHPAELNDFHAQASLTPNIFRFLVLWDRSQTEIADIQGVEDLNVRVQPD